MDMSRVRVASVGTALPGHAVSNAELASRFGMDQLWEQWIDAFVGIKSRHLSVNLDTGEICGTLADLGVDAARRALDGAGIVAGDVDLIVMGTATPDALMPTTANVVADRLGIGNLPTYQLQSGCAGAVQALEVATSLLASGAYRNALVLAGDSCAKHFDLDADLRTLGPSELVNVVLFGDGAGAAVLSTAAGPVTVRRVATRFTGVGRSPGQVVEWFGRAERDSTRAAVSEDYKAVETQVPALAVEALKELLDDLGWADDDVDFLLPPQLSGRMTSRISERLALVGAQEITRVDETGNCGNALLFFQLERLMSQIGPADRAVGIAVESSKWITGSIALEGL